MPLKDANHYLALYARTLNEHYVKNGAVPTDEAKMQSHAYALGTIVRTAEVDAVIAGAKGLVHHMMIDAAKTLLSDQLTEAEIEPYVNEAMTALQDKLVADISRDLPSGD